MPAIGAKRVGVIGAGMVGVCAASWLQRDGHSVFLIEPGEPGRGASFGNAGCFNGSSVTPVAMPGVHAQRAGLAVRPARAVGAALELSADDRAVAAALHPRRHAGEGAGGGARLAPARRADPRSAEAAGRAMPAPRTSSIVSAISMSTARPRAWRRIALAWDLRRENGVEIDEFDADELRQLEPALSRDYVRGVLVRENGHTSNPLALVERLVEHFLRSGGELVQARAHGFRLEGRRLTAIETDSGDLAGRCRGRLRRGLFEAARRRARRQGAARNRARLSPDDPRPRGDAAHPDRRCRRQVRRDPDGDRAALCRHGRACRARRRRPIGGAPASCSSRDARCCPASPRRTRKSGSRCGWAIARACPIAAGPRAVARDAGRDLRLRPRPCRHDLGADDRQDRRRPRRRPAALDRYRAVLCRPVR